MLKLHLVTTASRSINLCLILYTLLKVQKVIQTLANMNCGCVIFPLLCMVWCRILFSGQDEKRFSKSCVEGERSSSFFFFVFFHICLLSYVLLHFFNGITFNNLILQTSFYSGKNEIQWCYCGLIGYLLFILLLCQKLLVATAKHKFPIPDSKTLSFFLLISKN